MNIEDLKNKFCKAMFDNIENIEFQNPGVKWVAPIHQYYHKLHCAQESIKKIDRLELEIYMQEIINYTIDDLIESIKFS